MNIIIKVINYENIHLIHPINTPIKYFLIYFFNMPTVNIFNGCIIIYTQLNTPIKYFLIYLYNILLIYFLMCSL